MDTIYFLKPFQNIIVSCEMVFFNYFDPHPPVEIVGNQTVKVFLTGKVCFGIFGDVFGHFWSFRSKSIERTEVLFCIKIT